MFVFSITICTQYYFVLVSSAQPGNRQSHRLLSVPSGHSSAHLAPPTTMLLATPHAPPQLVFLNPISFSAHPLTPLSSTPLPSGIHQSELGFKSYPCGSKVQPKSRSPVLGEGQTCPSEPLRPLVWVGLIRDMSVSGPQAMERRAPLYGKCV